MSTGGDGRGGAQSCTCRVDDTLPSPCHAHDCFVCECKNGCPWIQVEKLQPASLEQVIHSVLRRCSVNGTLHHEIERFSLVCMFMTSCQMNVATLATTEIIFPILCATFHDVSSQERILIEKPVCITLPPFVGKGFCVCVSILLS